MSWRDDLVPASYRNVLFEAIELGGKEGRRLIVDEHPEIDDIVTDDLGAKAKTFRLRCFVSGDDYLDQRDALLGALRRPGVGDLVHPWRGRLRVRVADVEYTHDAGGGFCTIDVDFVEAGAERTLPILAVDEPATAAAAAVTATAATVVRIDAAGVAVMALPLYRPLVLGTLFVSELSDLSAILGPLSSGVTLLDVLDLGQQAATGENIAVALALADDVGRLLAYARRRSPYVLVTSGASPSETAAEAGRAELWLGLRVLCLTRACDLAAGATYLSADDAEQALGLVAGELADALLDVVDTDMYLSLIELRTATTDALVGAAERLPRLRTQALSVPLPALVVAYDLYGSDELTEREAEVVQLNGVGHPGFVVGPLEVLSR